MPEPLSAQRLFIDWSNWSFGPEFKFGPDKYDPLNQYRQIVVSFGPLIYVVRWPKAEQP